MANPLFLPVEIGEPTREYVHTVSPADEIVEYDGGDVVAYGDLSAEVQSAFDRAIAGDGGGFTVEDSDDRIDSLSYPDEPTLSDGIVVVEHESGTYALVTYTTERESGAVSLQRIVVQPVLFLLGFFSVFAGLLVTRDALAATA